jgi:hypothetical protein
MFGGAQSADYKPVLELGVEWRLIQQLELKLPLRVGDHQGVWVSCRLGLFHGIVGKAGIPFLEERPERTVEHSCTGLQQQVRAALRALHLLAF